SQFLHVVSASPTTSGASDRVEIQVHSLDASGDTAALPKLELAHHVTLRSAPPKGNQVVRFEDANAHHAQNKKMGRAKTLSAAARLPHVRLGCPSHLNFDGSITMECWFRMSSTRMQN